MPKYRFRKIDGGRIELEATTPEHASDLLTERHPDDLVECLFVDDLGNKFLFSENDDDKAFVMRLESNGSERVIH